MCLVHIITPLTLIGRAHVHDNHSAHRRVHGCTSPCSPTRAWLHITPLTDTCIAAHHLVHRSHDPPCITRMPRHMHGRISLRSSLTRPAVHQSCVTCAWPNITPLTAYVTSRASIMYRMCMAAYHFAHRSCDQPCINHVSHVYGRISLRSPLM